MFAKLRLLPGPLRVVAWLNLIIAGIQLVVGIAAISSGRVATILQLIGSALISFLVVLGILARSRVVRMLVLVFAWIGVVFYGAGLIFAAVTVGSAAVLVLVPLAISAVTVWGIRAEESKKYFGIGRPEGPPVTRDWMGNPIARAPDPKHE